MATQNFNNTIVKGHENMSPRKLAKLLDAECIEVKVVPNKNGGPDFCFILADGASVGQASRSIRENGCVIPENAVITGMIPNGGTKDDEFFIIHPQGAGEVRVLYDANKAAASQPGSAQTIHG